MQQQQQQQRKEGEPSTTTVVDMNYDVNGSVIQLRQTSDDPQQQSALVRGLTVTINQSRVAAWALFAFFAWGAMSELTKYMFRDAAAPLLVLWYVAGAIVVFVGLGALVLCFGRVRDAIVHMEERARGDNGYFKGCWGSLRRAILLGHRTSRVGGRAGRPAPTTTQDSVDRSEYRPLSMTECMTMMTAVTPTRGQSGVRAKGTPVSAAAAAGTPFSLSPSPLSLAPAPLAPTPPPPPPPSSSSSSSLSPPATRSFRSQLV